jgi:hypothetical protein
MDRLFAIGAIALVIAGFIGFFYFLQTKTSGRGLLFQREAMHTEEAIKPGEEVRLELILQKEEMHVAKMVYMLEVVPDTEEVEFGLVGKGKALKGPNIVGESINRGVARARVARPTTITDSVPPGRYEVVVQNRGTRATKAVIKVVLRNS